MVQIRGKQAIKNIAYMYMAQIIQLVLSIMMSMYIPMIIGLEEFSYWQLFIFYSSYVGILHLGLNDGVYLKYGGKQPDEESQELISNQLWVSIIAQVGVLILLFILLVIQQPSLERITVFCAVLVYAVISNIFNYCGSTLQALNKIKIYSTTLVIDKLFVVLSILILTLCGSTHFQVLIACFIIGKLLAMIVLLAKNKKLFLRKLHVNRLVLLEIGKNISSGSNLMLANIASSLIIGVGRFFIDINYPVTTFGIISFAFTMTGFVLALIAQVGASVFPILKSKSVNFLSELYPSINTIHSGILPFCYLGYPILVVFVTRFLNQYTESLLYFVYMLPMCVYEAKSSMLYNTYMKVLRKERILLIVNTISFLISFCGTIVSVYILNNVQALVVCLVVSVVIKSYMLHVFICKELHLPISENLSAMELLVTIIVVVGLNYYSDYIACSCFLAIIMTVYGIFTFRNTINEAKKLFINNNQHCI